MADQHANPVDEPLDDAPMIGTSLAVDINGAAAFIRWIPTLEALVADLRRLATAHPNHTAYTAVSTGSIGDHWPLILPARAGSRQEESSAASATSRKRAGNRPPLTRRETQVLSLTEAGCDAAEIAETLRLAVGTVYVHRCNARRKLREQRSTTPTSAGPRA